VNSEQYGRRAADVYYSPGERAVNNQCFFKDGLQGLHNCNGVNITSMTHLLAAFFIASI